MIKCTSSSNLVFNIIRALWLFKLNLYLSLLNDPNGQSQEVLVLTRHGIINPYKSLLLFLKVLAILEKKGGHKNIFSFEVRFSS